MSLCAALGDSYSGAWACVGGDGEQELGYRVTGCSLLFWASSCSRLCVGAGSPSSTLFLGIPPPIRGAVAVVSG